MKRILLSLSLLAAVFCSAAAQDTEVIKAYLKSMGSSTVVFTMSGTGLDGNTISQQKGVVQVQYPCFKIESGGQEIISDGTTTWIYNIATQEVVITGAMLEPMLPDASLNLNNSGKPLLKFSNKNRIKQNPIPDTKSIGGINLHSDAILHPLDCVFFS